jgi:hypothetical protein
MDAALLMPVFQMGLNENRALSVFVSEENSDRCNPLFFFHKGFRQLLFDSGKRVRNRPERCLSAKAFRQASELGWIGSVHS